MATVGLLAIMLIMMLMRVAMPIGAVHTGQATAQVALSFRERMLLQRTNIYAIGAVLLLFATTGQIATLVEIGTLIAVFGLLSLPVRYTFTTDGVGLNNVVFRPWNEFQSAQQTSRGLRLIPREGAGAFTIYVLGAHRDAASRAIPQSLTIPPATLHPAVAKGRRG